MSGTRLALNNFFSYQVKENQTDNLLAGLVSNQFQQPNALYNHLVASYNNFLVETLNQTIQDETDWQVIANACKESTAKMINGLINQKKSPLTGSHLLQIFRFQHALLKEPKSPSWVIDSCFATYSNISASDYAWLNEDESYTVIAISTPLRSFLNTIYRSSISSGTISDRDIEPYCLPYALLFEQHSSYLNSLSKKEFMEIAAGIIADPIAFKKLLSCQDENIKGYITGLSEKDIFLLLAQLMPRASFETAFALLITPKTLSQELLIELFKHHPKHFAFLYHYYKSTGFDFSAKEWIAIITAKTIVTTRWKETYEIDSYYKAKHKTRALDLLLAQEPNFKASFPEDSLVALLVSFYPINYSDTVLYTSIIDLLAENINHLSSNGITQILLSHGVALIKFIYPRIQGKINDLSQEQMTEVLQKADPAVIELLYKDYQKYCNDHLAILVYRHPDLKVRLNIISKKSFNARQVPAILNQIHSEHTISEEIKKHTLISLFAKYATTVKPEAILSLIPELESHTDNQKELVNYRKANTQKQQLFITLLLTTDKKSKQHLLNVLSLSVLKSAILTSNNPWQRHTFLKEGFLAKIHSNPKPAKQEAQDCIRRILETYASDPCVFDNLLLNSRLEPYLDAQCIIFGLASTEKQYHDNRQTHLKLRLAKKTYLLNQLTIKDVVQIFRRNPDLSPSVINMLGQHLAARLKSNPQAFIAAFNEALEQEAGTLNKQSEIALLLALFPHLGKSIDPEIQGILDRLASSDNIQILLTDPKLDPMQKASLSLLKTHPKFFDQLNATQIQTILNTNPNQRLTIAKTLVARLAKIGVITAAIDINTFLNQFPAAAAVFLLAVEPHLQASFIAAYPKLLVNCLTTVKTYNESGFIFSEDSVRKLINLPNVLMHLSSEDIIYILSENAEFLPLSISKRLIQNLTVNDVAKIFINRVQKDTNITNKRFSHMLLAHIENDFGKLPNSFAALAEKYSDNLLQQAQTNLYKSQYERQKAFSISAFIPALIYGILFYGSLIGILLHFLVPSLKPSSVYKGLRSISQPILVSKMKLEQAKQNSLKRLYAKSEITNSNNLIINNHGEFKKIRCGDTLWMTKQQAVRVSLKMRFADAAKARRLKQGDIFEHYTVFAMNGNQNPLALEQKEKETLKKLLTASKQISDYDYKYLNTCHVAR